MSAILGQVRLDGGPVEPRRLVDILSRREGASSGTEVSSPSPSAAFACSGGGHAAHVPGGILSVFDGEIHVRDALERTHDTGEDGSPAALLASGWRTWGDATVGHLYGDFAAAVLEPGGRRAALLRDHVGTRPLHWHLAGATLSFATFIPDLLALLPERPGPDEEGIAAFLNWPTAIGTHTLFAGIYSVAAGHMVLVDAAGAKSVRWWRPEDSPEVRHSRPQDYGDAFRALTETAVADRLPKKSVVGAHLSGGIDSTTVALMAADALRAEGRDLSAVYSWSPEISPEHPRISPDDERLRLQAICERWSLPLRYIPGSGAEERPFFARPFELDGMANVNDELPILDQAEQDGTQVILSGWGGDEAFSAHAIGVPRWMLSHGRLRDLLRLARARGGLGRPHRMAGFLWQDAISPLLPGAAPFGYGRRDLLSERPFYHSARLAGLLTPENTFGQWKATSDPRDDICRHLQLHHLGDRMATWAAWGAPRGIEYRYPLTDRRILEFVLGVSQEILWGDTRSRYLARQAAGKYLTRGLVKTDPANLRLRRQSFFACWQSLARDAHDGVFDGDCPWLDMKALRRDLKTPPKDPGTLDVAAYARIAPAIRVWHLAQRFGVMESVRLTQQE